MTFLDKAMDLPIHLFSDMLTGRNGMAWQRPHANRKADDVWFEQWFVHNTIAHPWAYWYVVECLVGRDSNQPDVLVQLTVNAIDTHSTELESWLGGGSFIRMNPCEAVATRRAPRVRWLDFIDRATRMAVAAVLRDGDRSRWTAEMRSALHLK